MFNCGVCVCVFDHSFILVFLQIQSFLEYTGAPNLRWSQNNLQSNKFLIQIDGPYSQLNNIAA